MPAEEKKKILSTRFQTEKRIGATNGRLAESREAEKNIPISLAEPAGFSRHRFQAMLLAVF